MPDFTSPNFGAPISFLSEPDKVGGNEMVSKFLKVKKAFKKQMEDITKDDIHARRYFCKSDCAYIFDVSILRNIVLTIEAEGGEGGAVFFQGLRTDENQEGKPIGRPTLIATAYKFLDDENLKNIKIKTYNKKGQLLPDDPTDGYEHPGDGTGETPGVQGDITSPVVEGSSEKGYTIKADLKVDPINKGWK